MFYSISPQLTKLNGAQTIITVANLMNRYYTILNYNSRGLSYIKFSSQNVASLLIYKDGAFLD